MSTNGKICLPASPMACFRWRAVVVLALAVQLSPYVNSVILVIILEDIQSIALL